MRKPLQIWIISRCIRGHQIFGRIHDNTTIHDSNTAPGQLRMWIDFAETLKIFVDQSPFRQAKWIIFFL